MIRLSIAFFILLFFVPEFSCLALPDNPDSTSSVIYIYRPKKYIGSGSSLKIYFNGVQMGKLTNGTKMKCIIQSEGIIEVKVKSKRPYTEDTCLLKVEHGKTYYLKAFWPNVSNARVDRVRPDTGTEDYNDKSLFRGGHLGIMVREQRHNPIPIKLFDYPKPPAPKASDEPKANGSGFCISNEGYIVTNDHVIKKSEFIFVKGIDGDFTTSYKATVAVRDEQNDLAILKIEDEQFKGWNDSIPYVIKTDLAEVGESIFVLGYPLTTTMGDEIKLTNGIISSKTGYKGNISLYQISAPVQPGNSGGPLFDKDGNLIGIVSAKHLDAENVTYAIKSNYLTNLIDLLPKPPALSDKEILKGQSLPDQVKKVKDFIVLIEIH